MQGRSGWYVGHLAPGGKASFTDLHDDPVTMAPTAPQPIPAVVLALHQ